MTESKARSIAKTLTWRVTGTGATMVVSFMMTGSLKVAGSIAAVQLVSNTLLYYVHERMWTRVLWGQQ